MLKLNHNKSIPKYFLALVGLVIAGYFALNAYPVGEWAGQRFLQTIPDGPQILGVVCASFMGICVIILFFYKEYMRETVSAYSLAKGDSSFERAFKWFVWFVMGLEFCSVAFRWMLLNGSAFGFVLLCLGLVGMGLTYVLGKMLHAEVNRPPSVAASELRDEAGRQVFDDSRKHLKGLSIADKRLIASGVPDPIDKVRDEKAAAREREVKAAEERRRIAEEHNRQNDEFYQKMITPPSDKVVSNGNSHF